MRFNLILFMNLAGIASSIGSPSPASLVAKFPRQLLQQCQHFVDRVGKFENCNVPNTFTSEFLEDKVPYMCFLTLNLIVEICRENGSDLWHNFETLYKARVNRTICPFNYATRNKNLGIEVNKYADYFRNQTKCEAVCKLNNRTLDDCIVMASINDLFSNLNEKYERVVMNAAPREPHLILGQVASQKVSKQIVANPRHKAENAQASIVSINGEDAPSVELGEILSKTEGKTTMKTETTSECETKDKEEKPNHAKIVENANPNSENKGIHTNNYSNNIGNLSAIKNAGKGTASIINTNSNIKAYNSNNNNNNDNIPHKKDNNNNIINEESDIKVEKDAVNAGKNNFTETEMPQLKGVNDPNIDSPSSGKKDYAYGSTIKGLPDEGENDENNEEIPENAQLQDDVSVREYDSGRVPNPKELYNGDGLFQAEDSHFSAYFLMTVSIIIIGYIIYHNKNKIVAYALEGRRGRNGRRRPTSASYRKLDCNLEEAIASNPSHASVTNVVY